MTMHNADNERIKRRYFAYLKGSQAPQRTDGGRGVEGVGALRGRYPAP